MRRRAVLPGVLLGAALPLLAGCAKPGTPAGMYKAYCARCHGEDGTGNPRSMKLYPNLDLVVSPMVRRGDRALVRERIAKGYGPMPGFSRRLTPQQIEALVDYTFELHRKAGE